MPGDAAFLIDEFLEALVAQLDKTQDALAFKAVNRPLTYAIKDFNLQLQVFVDLDGEGNVRLRSAGPNEAGASTMTIAFTTITRPMIEENTISLAAARGPSLADAGLDPSERKRLERLGVTNTEQLQRLGSSTGTSVVARLTQIPVDRLRTALQFGEPQIHGVHPVSRPPLAGGPGFGAGPSIAPRFTAARPDLAPGPSLVAAPPAGDGARPGGPNAWMAPALHPDGGPAPSPSVGGFRGPVLRSGPDLGAARPVIRLAPDTSHLVLQGTGLASSSGTPDITLDGRPVTASEADWDHVAVPIPLDLASGTLAVTLSDGSTSEYRLERQPTHHDGNGAWQPEVE